MEFDKGSTMERRWNLIEVAHCNASHLKTLAFDNFSISFFFFFQLTGRSPII